MNGDREVLEFVRSGRVVAGDDAAARVRAALAVPTGAASGGADAGAPGRRAPRLFAAALVLLGALVVAGVAWLQRGTAGTAPAQEPHPPRGQGGAPPALARAEDEPSVPQPLDLAATLRSAPLVLVVDVFFPSGVLATDGTFGTVRRVLQGDASLAGKEVWLHWNKDATADAPGCLDQVDLASVESLRAEGGERGFPWLLVLAPMSDTDKAQAGPTRTAAWAQRAGPLPWLHSPTGKGLPATKATRNAPDATGDAKAQVLAWLAAGCRDDDEAVRATSVRALAAAGEVPPGFDPSPLAADPLPQVRADAVPLLPRERLLPLAFDRSAAVRNAALARLDGGGAPRGLGSLRAFGPGGFWAVLSTPRGWRTWEYRVLAKAESEHIDGYVGAFLRQLHQKESSVNHLFGALGLGRSGDKQQLPELVALASHEDGSVRVAAAWSRVLLGDRAGHDLLRTMALGNGQQRLRRQAAAVAPRQDDPAAPAAGEGAGGEAEADGDVAMMALDAVRALECVESFTTLAAAAKSKVAAVRALAAAGLREQRARGEHEVDALLAELRKDPMEIVRLAAAAR